MSRFSGKVAIVTGSSNGIGRATAVLLGKEGAKVTITGRNPESLKETRNQLITVGVAKADILEVIGNIVLEETQRELVDKTVKTFGKLDILVNNAGGLPDKAGSHGLEQPTENYDYTMNLNIKSIVTLTKYALPHLIKSKGEIVNVSSIAGLALAVCISFSRIKCTKVAEMPFYSMAKAALDNFTRSMAIRYADDGIRVNSVNPGTISTAILEKQGVSKEGIKQFETSVAARIPLKRAGQQSEIAHTIAFLCDRNACGFITGQTIVVDGGATLVPHAFTTDDKKPLIPNATSKK